MKAAIIRRLRAGQDLVPAIIEGVFEAWTCSDPDVCGEDCAAWVAYNTTAPDVAALDAFRDAVGNHVLGSWTDACDPGAWCATHTREDAIVVFQR